MMAVLFGSVLAVATSTAATPISNIQGEYAGTLKSKNQVINTEQESPGSDTSITGLVINQDGQFTEAYLVVFGEGSDENTTFYMQGAAGNGKFHLTGSDNGEEGTLFLVGTMKGAPGKRVLKAKGAYLSGSHYSDVKVSLKEGDSGIEL
jgi:hypothetical protein